MTLATTCKLKTQIRTCEQCGLSCNSLSRLYNPSLANSLRAICLSNQRRIEGSSLVVTLNHVEQCQGLSKWDRFGRSAYRILVRHHSNHNHIIQPSSRRRDHGQSHYGHELRDGHRRTRTKAEGLTVKSFSRHVALSASVLDTSQPSIAFRQLPRFSDECGDPVDVFQVAFEASKESVFINLAR